MWRLCSSSMCWKLALWPDCWVVITNRFGKPRVNRPWKVLAPSFHFSVNVRPLRPVTSKPSRRVKSVPTSKPVPKIRQSSAYSLPATTTPRGVMRSTPWPNVSTRCTLGRLKVGRYWSWKQGRLQNWLYQGFSASAVAGSCTTASTRARTFCIFRSSARCTRASGSAMSPPAWAWRWAARAMLLMRSVQPSLTRSTSKRPPEITVVKLCMRSRCQPGCRLLTQSGSVGRSLRTSTDDGVRWKTNNSFAPSPRCGTHCTAVAPVPMMPTRLSARPVRPPIELPPV